jgi:hypothetical protein
MTSSPSPSARLFAARALRSLGLGLLAMAAVAWMVTPAGVGLGLLFGLPAAFLGPRFPAIRGALLAAVLAGTLGVHLGVWLFEGGTTGARLVAALVATLAVAPWLFLLTFVLWVRSRAGGGGPG